MNICSFRLFFNEYFKILSGQIIPERSEINYVAGPDLFNSEGFVKGRKRRKLGAVRWENVPDAVLP